MRLDHSINLNSQSATQEDSVHIMAHSDRKCPINYAFAAASDKDLNTEIRPCAALMTCCFSESLYGSEDDDVSI